MSNEYFEQNINELKAKYPVLKNIDDYKVFIYLYIKYFFFSEVGNTFDPEIIEDYITDGANDGGIDAIFNDENSEDNDLIVLQSKYYKNSKLDFESISGELCKIKNTLKKLRENKISEFNDKLVTAYRNATSQMGDDASIRVIFFTSYQPKDKRERKKLDKNIKELFGDDDIEINFRSDINEQIEMCDMIKAFVEYDRLDIDDDNNFLKYNDSVIVNISARSLQNLENRRRNGLLGMNLRYYVKSKKVDDGIDKTIKNEPDKFWYKNNGILIICDDYNIENGGIELWNFSIVNGGQTTNRIGHTDIEKDFYIQGKIVKSEGKTREEKDKFSSEIAESTNSQKPIKPADLKANTPEQARIKEELFNRGIYYITKKGDKIPTQYKEKECNMKIDIFGKLALSSIIQMPGSARSNVKRIYSDEYYPLLYTTENVGIVSDMFKIYMYYEEFLKSELKSRMYKEKDEIPIMKNSKMHQCACIALLAKLANEVIDIKDLQEDNSDKLTDVIRLKGNMNKVIVNRNKDEKKIIFELFDLIGLDILTKAFSDYEGDNKAAVPSNFLKSDDLYYKYILNRICREYIRNSGIKECIEKLFIKKK